VYVWHYGLVLDLILYGMILFLVKFNFFVLFLVMFAIYLMNENYYYCRRIIVILS